MMVLGSVGRAPSKRGAKDNAKGGYIRMDGFASNSFNRHSQCSPALTWLHQISESVLKTTEPLSKIRSPGIDPARSQQSET